MLLAPIAPFVRFFLRVPWEAVICSSKDEKWETVAFFLRYFPKVNMEQEDYGKKKASGCKGKEKGIGFRELMPGLHLLKDVMNSSRNGKQHRNQASLHVIQCVRKNISSRCPQTRQKGKMMETEIWQSKQRG